MSRICAILAVVAVGGLAWAASRPSTAMPAASVSPPADGRKPPGSTAGPLLPPPRQEGQKNGSWRIRKYTEPTGAEIARNRSLALSWYDKAREDISPSLHLVETRNFLIFSAWSRGNDQRLGEVCQTMYAHLRQQLALPREQAVWAGKLPVYIFAEKEHFQRFSNEVDCQKMPEAGGYLSHRSDGFCHVVLNQVHGKTYFYGLLVHEGTHAFLARYLTNAPLPTWVNEGLAETMSARLVPGCSAARRYVRATGEALDRDADVSGIFREVGLDDFDYGVAQSLVRFLLARDRKAFVEFLKLLKGGMEQGEALSRSYGWTPAELQAQWKTAARRALGRQR